MNLVNRERCLQGVGLVSLCHPSGVGPTERLVAGNHRSGVGTELGLAGIRVCLLADLAPGGSNSKFIKCTYAETLAENLPDTGVADPGHGRGKIVPAVKIAHNGNCGGIGSPHSKINALLALNGGRMCTELFINRIMCTMAKQIAIHI